MFHLQNYASLILKRQQQFIVVVIRPNFSAVKTKLIVFQRLGLATVQETVLMGLMSPMVYILQLFSTLF
jgi:hypothetical protein